MQRLREFTMGGHSGQPQPTRTHYGPTPRSGPTLLLLILSIAVAGCGKARDKARLDLAQMNISYTDSAFIDNAKEGNSEVVKLFLEAGMDIEVKTTGGQTALMIAALTNKTDVAKLLLEKGADVNAKNKHGGTALMTAAWKGHKEIAQLLLAENPDLKVKDNRRRWH
jgi:ankyrin repeat protein